jgi:hypothetical protein
MKNMLGYPPRLRFHVSMKNVRARFSARLPVGYPSETREDKGKRKVDLTCGPHMSGPRHCPVSLTRWQFNKANDNLDVT